MFVGDCVWACVCSCIYLHTDEKLYLKLLENKSNSDQNAFQAHYLEIYLKTWVCSWGNFSAFAKSFTIMNGGYSALFKEGTIFVFESETNIQSYSRVLSFSYVFFILATKDDAMILLYILYKIHPD